MLKIYLPMNGSQPLVSDIENPSGTRKIFLTQGEVAIVDAADYQDLSKQEWHAVKAGRTRYAACRILVNGKKTTRYMHQVILNTPVGIRVDHIDRDGLHNCRSNLRLATVAENASNHRRYSNNSSGFMGVGFHKSSGKWQARIKVKGVLKHLGFFDSRLAAALERDRAATKLHGPFASLNSPVTFGMAKTKALLSGA